MYKPQRSIAAKLGIDFAAGVATMLLLHLFLPAKEIYSKYSLLGEEALPPFVQFIVGFNLTRLLLLGVAAVLGFFTWRICVPAGVAYWAGATAVPALIVAVDAEAYQGQFGFLAVVVLALLHGFFIFWPVVFGTAGGAALGALISRYSCPANQSPAP